MHGQRFSSLAGQGRAKQYGWQKAETLAGLEPRRGRGWHSLRRKFASDLMNLPLKVFCELGGWKKAQTVLRCFGEARRGRPWDGLGERNMIARS